MAILVASGQLVENISLMTIVGNRGSAFARVARKRVKTLRAVHPNEGVRVCRLGVTNMKPGDLFIVTRVPKCAEPYVRRGDEATLLRVQDVYGDMPDGVVHIAIHRWEFFWALEDLLRISL